MHVFCPETLSLDDRGYVTHSKYSQVTGYCVADKQSDGLVRHHHRSISLGLSDSAMHVFCPETLSFDDRGYVTHSKYSQVTGYRVADKQSDGLVRHHPRRVSLGLSGSAMHVFCPETLSLDDRGYVTHSKYSQVTGYRVAGKQSDGLVRHHHRSISLGLSDSAMHVFCP